MFDQSLSWPFITALVVALLIFGYFINEAHTKSDWTRPKSMIAEFGAVLFAISVGIWINGLERQIDRDDAREERQEEREEAAEIQLKASIQYIAASIQYQSNDPFSFANDLIVRPNIIATLVSAPEVAQRFEGQFGDFAQQYVELLRVSPASLEDCGATREMYVDQRRQQISEYAANAWISHAFMFEIHPEDNPFDGGHSPDNAQILERIGRLSEVHDCIIQSIKTRLHRSFHLYEALCLAAAEANIEDGCDWTYISHDPTVRTKYYEERYKETDDGLLGEPDRDYSSGVNASQVVDRFIGIQTQLEARRQEIEAL